MQYVAVAWTNSLKSSVPGEVWRGGGRGTERERVSEAGDGGRNASE